MCMCICVSWIFSVCISFYIQALCCHQASTQAHAKRSRKNLYRHVMLLGPLLAHCASATEWWGAGHDGKRKDLSHSKLSGFLKMVNLHYYWHLGNNELIINSGSSLSVEEPPCCLLDFRFWTHTHTHTRTERVDLTSAWNNLTSGSSLKKERRLLPEWSYIKTKQCQHVNSTQPGLKLWSIGIDDYIFHRCGIFCRFVWEICNWITSCGLADSEAVHIFEESSEPFMDRDAYLQQSHNPKISIKTGPSHCKERKMP